MPRPLPDPETIRQAKELVAAGCSFREAGETLGVTATTISRWVAAPEPAAPSTPPPPAELPAHMRPTPPPPLEPIDVDVDPIALVRQLIAEQRAAIQADRAAGNMRGAASNAATLERLVKSLKQLEAGAREDGDGTRITAAEVARIEASLVERVTAICNRPILCSSCSRALSVYWGTGEKVAPPAP